MVRDKVEELVTGTENVLFELKILQLVYGSNFCHGSCWVRRFYYIDYSKCPLFVRFPDFLYTLGFSFHVIPFCH